MDRAYQSNASSAPPTAPTFSLGYPQGDAAQPIVPPTEPGAFWFYWVTESIRNVIVAAGLTPNNLTLNQLVLALEAIAIAAAVTNYERGETSSPEHERRFPAVSSRHLYLSTY